MNIGDDARNSLSPPASPTASSEVTMSSNEIASHAVSSKMPERSVVKQTLEASSSQLLVNHSEANSSTADREDTPSIMQPAPRTPVQSRSLDTPSEPITTPTATPPPGNPPPSPSTNRTNENDRTRRRRSAMDFRNGPRLTELFSNFLHRRQVDDANAMPPENIPRTPSPTTLESIANPLPKVEPPPPALPPATLADLGLSMSVLTSNLSPSHFSAPPTSGTYLAPNYLLLCHAQGLDVLPLVTPPSREPYALVRRVSFKSVVVMEERGVLIAIAGKRDGVRVYALDELRRVIEWRLDLETRKERERSRKEDSKKLSGSIDQVFAASVPRKEKPTLQGIRLSAMPNGLPPQPRSPTVATIKKPVPPKIPTDAPPAYTPSNVKAPSNSRRPLSMIPSSDSRSRSGSVSTVIPASQRALLEEARSHETEHKGDWVEAAGSSDDEALSLAAAGASGSAALDERTSAMPNVSESTAGMNVTINNSVRPPNFRDLRAQSVAVLSTIGGNASSPSTVSRDVRVSADDGTREGDLDVGNDEEDEPSTPTGEISLAQALLESRLPDLPPPGTRTTQQAILIPTPSNPEVAPGRASPVATRQEQESSAPSSPATTRVARRRWSILGPSHSDSARNRPEESRAAELLLVAPANRSPPPSPSRSVLRRTNSSRTAELRPVSMRPPINHTHSASNPEPVPPQSAPAHANARHITPPLPPSASRFIPRIFSAALGTRRSEENMKKNSWKHTDKDANKGFTTPIGAPPPPQPKLDYVKLPGTKGSVSIKAVETGRKSFLAILCGDAGEKVELFAGTYRTALSLSRTFILPDSPRSLELQVQGDDLVEIYLVFSQNVFGLEPATVRVREVRIGRAERRAARRRAREGRTTGGDDTPIPEAPDEETNVSVNIGVVGSSGEGNGLINGTGREGGDEPDPDPEPQVSLPTTTSSDAQELMAIATAQMAPYTTFQQLSFAPAFPLATLGDDVIIPPSYPAFLRHRDQHENGANDLFAETPAQQFTPPGLPPPRMILQCKWYYRDPKGVIQGPWKTSLMQSWYKDGLLPVDLPVRRDIDTDFIPLRELRALSVDPEHPFKQYAPTTVTPTVETPQAMEAKPLLPPVSILEQPRHFGPPALFFSSRGGHSTTIVDAKGRPVLKGRFMWSADDEAETEQHFHSAKLGDIKRVEAFDVQNRAIIVALRQGGLEAVDVGDALYKPADESRAYIPLYQAPTTGFNRRGSYIWRIGGPLTVPQTASPIASYNPRGSVMKKSSLRSPARTEFSTSGEDTEYNSQEEVLFLGRKDDELYICERNAVSFRILRLSPSS